MTPRRLAIYSTQRGHPWGAPDMLCARAAQAALAAGHRVFLVVRPQIVARPEITGLREAGATVRLVPEFAYGGRLGRLTAKLRGLRTGSLGTLRALARFQPDLLIVNQSSFYDFLSEDALRAFIARTKTTYAVLAHSNREGDALTPAARAEAVDFIAGAKTFFGVSSFMLTLAERQLLTRFSNTAIFQNPFALPVNLPLPWPRSDVPALAVVSRLDAHGKGLDILFEALKISPGLSAPWRLEVFGEGPDAAYLRELAEWLGLAERIAFRGHVPDKGAIWATNQLLVLPSRFEGAPASVIEALLCGRPVLRTNYGGAAEWMRDGVTGFLCPAAEPGLLAETLATAFARQSEWEAMGRAGHRHASALIDRAPEQALLALLGSGDRQPPAPSNQPGPP